MGEEQKEREKIPSSLHAVSTEPDVGLELTKLKDTSLTEPPRHPLFCIFIYGLAVQYQMCLSFWENRGVGVILSIILDLE